MLIHKFGIKPFRTEKRLLTIMWKPDQNIKYKPKKKSLKTWEIYCQQELCLKPKETKIIQLHFGIEMSEGVVFISLQQELKTKDISIHNGTVLESVDNICISLYNNSVKDVNIMPGQLLCFIYYLF